MFNGVFISVEIDGRILKGKNLIKKELREELCLRGALLKFLKLH